MTTSQIPARGTAEYDWWLAGATAESAARRKNVPKDVHTIYETVETMVDNDYNADGIVWMVAVVFTCEWSLRDRLRLAWRMLRPVPRRRRNVKVYVEPRDVWVGYFRGDDHHYVCPMPCLVIRWDRRKR